MFGTAEIVRMCRPAGMRCGGPGDPGQCFATVWPPILTLAATFQPKFATLITMRRPPGLAAALATETAEKTMRIKRNLLMLAGQAPHRIHCSTIARRIPHSLNAPERAVRAKLGDFAGGLFTDVNSDGNDTDERAHENRGHDPRRYVPDAQGVIKRYDIGNWRTSVQKDFCEPRHQDQDENEYVIPFHPASDCF